MRFPASTKKIDGDDIFFGYPARAARFSSEEGDRTVAKPPKSTPHSDIDGVHRDGKRNTDAAQESGETSAGLALARNESVGKPPHTDKQGHDESE